MCEPLSAERIPLCGRSLCLGQLCLGHRAKLTNAGVGSPGREVKIAEESGRKIGGRGVCRSRRGQTNHSRVLRVVARVVRRAGLLPVRRWSAEALVFGGRHNDPAGVRALADRGPRAERRHTMLIAPGDHDLKFSIQEGGKHDPLEAPKAPLDASDHRGGFRRALLNRAPERGARDISGPGGKRPYGAEILTSEPRLFLFTTASSGE